MKYCLLDPARDVDKPPPGVGVWPPVVGGVRGQTTETEKSRMEVL
jgi:hypothetical protein